MDATTEKTVAIKSVLLLIAGILGVLYAIYLVVYFTGANAGAGDSAEMVGVGIATALVMPHMLCTVVAVVFNVIAWVLSKRAFALVAGILYAVAAVLFIAYAPFVLVQMVLCFVGFAKLPKVAPRS